MTAKFNDFVIRFANVNGSRFCQRQRYVRQGAFRMGIPVATRNISLRIFRDCQRGLRFESARRAIWDGAKAWTLWWP